MFASVIPVITLYLSNESLNSSYSLSLVFAFITGCSGHLVFGRWGGGGLLVAVFLSWMFLSVMSANDPCAVALTWAFVEFGLWWSLLVDGRPKLSEWWSRAVYGGIRRFALIWGLCNHGTTKSRKTRWCNWRLVYLVSWLSWIISYSQRHVKIESKTTGELDREGAIAWCKQETMKRQMMCVFSLGSSYKQESGQMTKDKYIQTLHSL